MEDPLQPTDISPTPPQKRLHRSSDNRMLLGVCGGLGDYFDIDATLIRVVFAIAMLAFGSGLLVYVVLAFIMPAQEMLESPPRDAARSTIDEAADEIRSGVDWVREHRPGRKKKE